MGSGYITASHDLARHHGRRTETRGRVLALNWAWIHWWFRVISQEESRLDTKYNMDNVAVETVESYRGNRDINLI